jgi:hypothetical protein
VPSLRVLWSKIVKPSVKTSIENISTADPSGNRTNRGNSQYIVVGAGTDRKTSESNTGLVVSKFTEVHTSTSTVPYQYQDGAVYQGQPFYGQQQTGGPFGEVQPPFGVYTEAYALQTRQNGVWGR